LKTAFIGTSDFAAAVLRSLAASAHRPSVVVTRPDRPRGRGRKVASPPAADAARELGIEVVAPQDSNDAIDALRGSEAVCVCAYGQLIREPLLSAFELLNVHPSLLPRWRGAAPIERAIMAGDERTGVSIMRVTAELDAGAVCAQESEQIAPGDTYGTLSQRLEELGARLLIGALDGPRTWVEQTEEGVTYAEKLGPEDRVLDPARGAAELERVVRALQPHIGARTPDGLGVLAARVAERAAPAGELRAEDGRLLYGVADGALELLEVRPPGGKAMEAAAFMRGHSLQKAR
jgi:methionyl-tRNA formyltransferase